MGLRRGRRDDVTVLAHDSGKTQVDRGQRLSFLGGGSCTKTGEADREKRAHVDGAGLSRTLWGAGYEQVGGRSERPLRDF